LRDWLARPECWGEAAPGTVFDYANLGYVLIAAMAERMAGARFDRLARRELARIGVEGGFNWSGVPPAARARRLATYRRAGGRFLPQIDGQVSARGLSGPEGRELRLGSWRAGEAPGVFSPQGGLRINLSGALGLARSLSEADGPVLWSGPTDAPEVFQSYGLGVQFLDTPAFWPRPVMGHFGNAYGFAGGLWKDRVTGVAFVVALNGLPEGDEDDRLREEELALYGALAHACG
jgi:CubicO group peptidase (beta-lactamase class C family)